MNSLGKSVDSTVWH